jgi:hypothetical protein
MAKSLAVLLFLGSWMILDRWIDPLLSIFKEKDLEKLTSIVNMDLERLQKLRIRKLKQFRAIVLIFLGIEVSLLRLGAYVFLNLFSYMYPYIRLKNQVHQVVQQVRYQFPIYLRQLQVLLQNNTVVSAIEASLDQVPNLFRKDIMDLHQALLKSPMDINNYLNCMKIYELPEVTRAMKWLYRYQSLGTQDVNRQFNRMIISTTKWLRQTRLDGKQQQLMIYQWWGMLPLFGVTLVFLSAMMSVANSFF